MFSTFCLQIRLKLKQILFINRNQQWRQGLLLKVIVFANMDIEVQGYNKIAWKQDDMEILNWKRIMQ